MNTHMCMFIGSILLWHFHPRLELGERTCLCSLPQMLAWAEPCDHQPRRLHCNPLGTSYRTTQKLQLVLSTVAACLHENVSWRKWTVPAFCCQPRTRFRGKIDQNHQSRKQISWAEGFVSFEPFGSPGPSPWTRTRTLGTPRNPHLANLADSDSVGSSATPVNIGDETPKSS